MENLIRKATRRALINKLDSQILREAIVEAVSQKIYAEREANVREIVCDELIRIRDDLHERFVMKGESIEEFLKAVKSYGF